MDSTFFHRYDEEFLAFIAAGELRIPVHTETGRALGLHQRAWCVDGDHRVQWRPASGRGVVLSFTVTRRVYASEFPAPLIHGLIELDEGPQLICRLDGVAPEGLATGQRVHANFDRQGLVFRPVDDGITGDAHAQTEG